MNMQEVRARFPQYEDMGDVELATALHRKFYSDMPVADFYKSVGLTESLDPTEGMGTLEKARAGFGKALMDTGRGVAQILMPESSEAPLQASIDESKRLDAPLLNTGAGAFGNLLGNVAIAAPTAAIPGANTVIGSAALGGLMGGLQPTATGESTLDNIGTGVAFGAAGQALGNAAPKIAGALVRPFTSGGRETIAAEVLRRFARDPDAIANATGASRVPGVQMTLAEATQDPGLASLQRAAQSMDPIVAGDIAERNMSNTLAVRNALSGIAGDDAAMAAAQTARKQASNPLYTAARQSTAEVDPGRTVSLIDRILKANPANKALNQSLGEIRETLFEAYPAQQRGSDAWKVLNDALQGRNAGAPGSTDIKAARTVLDRLRKGTVTADEALKDLKRITPKGKAFTGALDLAKQYVSTPDYVVRQNPQAIISAIDNIKAILANQDNAFVKRELTTVKKSLMHQLSKTVPEFAQAEKAFAQGSRPINQMELGRALYEKFVPALADTPGVTLDRSRAQQFAEALRSGDEFAKRATGFKGATMANVLDPAQMQTLGDVQEFLARRATIDATRPAGSNTAQNLASQNIMRQVIGPLGLPQSWAESVASQTLGRGISAIARPAEEAIQQRLVEALMNPQTAAQMMQRLQPSQQAQLAQSLYRYALPAAAVGSGAYAAGQ
jgi:hypothetical protein